jgi:hypothetical protein
MGMHEARGTLAKSFKELMLRWAETRAAWDDAQAAHFEQTYLRNLESDLKVAASAMDQVSIVLNQAKRDCE